jgi:beta-1,4-mannosyltransferase
LAPVPLAIILWLGWFIFTEAVRLNPAPISLPYIITKAGPLAYASTKPVRLVFRFVTKGDNTDVLRDSVVAVHQAFVHYQQVSGPYQIEIVSECPVSLNLGIGITTNIYVVPPDYITQHHSRFKARALTYLQECVRPQLEDWYIYLDEESLIDEKLLAGLYRFVKKSIEREARALYSKKKHHPSGWIGQGAILYQGGNWFFRGADALRTADDLGRFRLQYALGKPFFGIHGSFIVIRGVDDARLPFDVGSANSITEDAAWALRAWAQGYRFAWVDGYLHEQPPQRVKDFIGQRSRWLSGIRAVLVDTTIPFIYRLCLAIFTGLWQIAFLPFLIAVVALFVHASPFYWMRLPADFAWATFILAYLHGIDIQAKHSHPFLKKKKIELQCKRVVSWLLVFCSIWYALLEAAGVIYSLRRKQGFFVIQKPSLAAENKIDTTHMQVYQQSWNTVPMERKV